MNHQIVCYQCVCVCVWQERGERAIFRASERGCPYMGCNLDEFCEWTETLGKSQNKHLQSP